MRIKLKANQSRYLDIFTASRVIKALKFHIHDITSPFKFPLWNQFLNIMGELAALCHMSNALLQWRLLAKLCVTSCNSLLLFFPSLDNLKFFCFEHISISYF